MAKRSVCNFLERAGGTAEARICHDFRGIVECIWENRGFRVVGFGFVAFQLLRKDARPTQMGGLKHVP